MEKVRIEAELPATLAAQSRAFVADGCAADLDDLLAEALRRFPRVPSIGIDRRLHEGRCPMGTP